MTGKMIFKMEMFKFWKDKAYLFSALAIGILNTIVTLIALAVVSNMANGDMYYSETAEALIGVLFLVGFLLILGSGLFMFIYPFRAVSADYKNNVMALMVASGVNRTKLYFAKIGAIILAALILAMVISLVPIILITVRISTEVGLAQVVDAIAEVWQFFDMSAVQILVNSILSYLQALILIIFVCIWLKGSNLSFLLFIGLSIAISIVSGILNLFSIAFDFSFNAMLAYSSFITLIITVALMFLSLSMLRRQNL